MSDRMDRRAAIEVAMLMLGGAAITLSGCGGGSSSPTDPNPTPGPGDKVGAISGNHGHSAIITAAQLTAGSGLRLDIQGGATHNHTLELLGAEVVQIRDGQRVATGSSVGDGHTHTVAFN